MKILGTPIGSDAFVQAKEERRLWEATPWVPDVQCGWQILLQCAGPRCQHFLRTVPPSQSARYAQSHDTGMRHAMEAVLGGVPRSSEQKSTAHKIKSLPMRLGGLGLRSAERMKPVAFWASSADALPMRSNRLTTLTDQVENELGTGVGGTPCMLELSTATHTLDRSGFVDRPGWHQLRMGARPPLVASSEPGEWQHGWQSRVFPSRAPLSGDRDSCQVMCRGPGSFALSRWSWCQRCVARHSNGTGIQNGAPLVPHPRSRETSPPTARDGSLLRMWLPWMCGADTGLLAQGQVRCGPGLSVRNGPWPVFAKKQVPLLDATLSSET